MRYFFLIVMFVCLGCTNNSNDSNSNNKNENSLQINTELSHQRTKEIAKLENQIKEIDLFIAGSTRNIKSIPSRNREMVIIDQGESDLDRQIRTAGSRSRRYSEEQVEEENQHNYARIDQLRSERELLMGKLMILYKIEQESNR